jgi:hypothetical protein
MKKQIFLGILKVTEEGSRIQSRIRIRWSTDPDSPQKNVTDPPALLCRDLQFAFLHLSV